MQTTNEFQDAEGGFSYDPEKLSFRSILLMHIQRLTVVASVEFIGGYWQDSPIKKGAGLFMSKTYVPDSRAVYQNSLDCLYDLTYPYFDTEMTKFSISWDKDWSLTENELEKAKEETPKNFKIKYWELRILHYRKLFRALSCFLKRENYFKSKSGED